MFNSLIIFNAIFLSKFHQFDFSIFFIFSSENLYLIILAGFHTAMAYGGIFLLTNELAQIIAQFQIVTHLLIIESTPIHTSFHIIQSFFVSSLY
jgi:hypothetical protein